VAYHSLGKTESQVRSLLRAPIYSERELYKVYWTAPDGVACSEDFAEMVEALTQANHLRTIGRAYVVMASENPNQVGQMGVDSVKDGHLPNGNAYTWKMRR
jgi:hypothetical protein